MVSLGPAAHTAEFNNADVGAEVTIFEDDHRERNHERYKRFVTGIIPI
jgi:hypothetical protein